MSGFSLPSLVGPIDEKAAMLVTLKCGTCLERAILIIMVPVSDVLRILSSAMPSSWEIMAMCT
eukprot:CAMPEP_0206252854 /NCGR_PEP_ID=MMETSP0047_2-20121206/22838_1 /ASSEMBLY_ACC=CAM_ASM_000192 /TAXON_ID=195065 /ORGANISM="Chroomonas mesostigmatica_cf, Strain CCMP1168" /LENGTH=62 /DNA_ID=CAMNT_0053679019 /DNA_START=108 /DNA_END=296 /DNA_ORIENTATION=+